MREKYLLELGGEHTELGKYEALELFKFKNGQILKFKRRN